MHRAATAILVALAAGCGGGFEFRDAVVLYRTPLEGGDPLCFGFVNAGNSVRVKDGAPAEDLPGAKPVDEETAGDCLERLAGEGFPAEWEPAGDLRGALASHPKQHVLVAEVDGSVRVLARPVAASDADTVARLRRFVASKEALIETAGYRTGFRVVSNKAGAALFEDEQARLRKDPKGGSK
jgi:hypothetical protein